MSGGYGMNGHLLAFMVKPPPLKFRVEKLTANGWRTMGWAGSTEEAEDLAAHGLGGVCRITECDGREYRRAVRLEAIETGRRAA